MLAPLMSILVFLAVITSAFAYLRVEEINRTQERVNRDVEYAQQRLRLRLFEQREQLLQLARDTDNGVTPPPEFIGRAKLLISQYPELESIRWIDDQQRLQAAYVTPGARQAPHHAAGAMGPPAPASSGAAAADRPHGNEPLEPKFSLSTADGNPAKTLQLRIPLFNQNRRSGVVLGEFSMDRVLRYGIPSEIQARYALSLRDSKNRLLAGEPDLPPRWYGPLELLVRKPRTFELPVSLMGNALLVRAQTFQTSPGLINSALFLLVAALSLLTVWMLAANWRHTQRRQQTQRALVAETNFRRAMENSLLTGVRVLDLTGCITYVNAAFSRMTGWDADDLVGCMPPYPYWPDGMHELMSAHLENELQGTPVSGGLQALIKRKNGTVFNARLYTSPLIDAHGQQSGWMASITDITEPMRIRQQLSASQERFTAVLEAIDAAISVAPIGSAELLFANRLYRQWFGADTAGHLSLVAQAGTPSATQHNVSNETHDPVDALAGLPQAPLTDTQPANNEIFITPLGRWLEVRSRYLTWVDGRLAQMVIATDITARHNAEEQAAAQAERAQAASRLMTVGEMASSVAHELNQPLTAIVNYCNGMISRIRSRSIEPPALVAALEKTIKQTQRAGQVIERIRSFVKRSELNRYASDTSAIVSEAIELAGIELRRRNVRLTHEVAAQLPPLMVDPILIEQVLVNLLRNAAEAIDMAQRPSGQRRVLLRVQPITVQGQEAIEFSVQDTGHGLAPEVTERLFEAFFSTKPNGMGMGLNLCRSIVESHLGRMQAQNLYNGQQRVGCCFSFWIPVQNTVDSPREGAKVLV